MAKKIPRVLAAICYLHLFQRLSLHQHGRSNGVRGIHMILGVVHMETRRMINPSNVNGSLYEAL